MISYEKNVAMLLYNTLSTSTTTNAYDAGDPTDLSERLILFIPPLPYNI